MKIAFVDSIGLPFDGTTVYKHGLGGSESAVSYMSEELAALGFTVYVFNDCISNDCSPGIYNNVNYLPLSKINSFKEGFDIFIASRSIFPFIADRDASKMIYTKWRDEYNNILFPDITEVVKRSKHRVLWLHDTFCEGDDLIEELVLNGAIHKVFTLSDWHTTYVTNCNHGKRRNFEVLKPYLFQTRNAIKPHLEEVDLNKKVKNSFVYNSSYTKGMDPLVRRIWPKIKEKLPDATLTVIGGYYRFDENSFPDDQERDVMKLVKEYDQTLGIKFTGVIPQKEIAEICAKSSFMLYPPTYPETSGISTLESLYYNTPLITCTFGALEETALSLACYKIPYAIEPHVYAEWIDAEAQYDAFVDLTLKAASSDYLLMQKQGYCNIIKELCTWDKVALQWKQYFFSALKQYLPVEEYREVSRINYEVTTVFGRSFVNPEFLSAPSSYPEQKIQVVVCAYNAEEYIKSCIDSIKSQNYTNYKVTIVDDSSTDSTAKVILDNIDDKFNLVINDKNKGALRNQVEAIRTFDDTDIVILIDGDDKLFPNPNIFTYYNEEYSKQDLEFTYGSIWSTADNIPLIAQSYPEDVRYNKQYRQHTFDTGWMIPYTHLRTFKKFLINDISDESFKNSGNWMKAGGDVALFYGLIEEAHPDKIKAVQKIFYRYNDCNPINDYKINAEEQTKNAKHAMRKIIETKKEKTILIAVPTDRNIHVETFQSIYELEIPEGYTTKFQYFYGYQVDQIRNFMANWACSYDYLFSVDSDIILPKDALVRLLGHDKDIVTGLYVQRNPNMPLELYRETANGGSTNYYPEEVQGFGLMKVKGCGFGCVLVKNKVLATMGYPWFKYQSSLVREETISEDIFFCQKALNSGFELWADTDLTCGHVGKQIFEVPKVDMLLKNRTEDLLPLPMRDFIYDYLYPKREELPVIYDIGSCTLHWTRHIKNCMPEADVILFEAMDECERFYEGYKYNMGVLSSVDGKEVDFYQNVEHPGGNSYYREDNPYGITDLFAKPENKVKKITKKLDTVVAEKEFPLPNLIKLDVQGAELDILKGAELCVDHAKYILLEAQNKFDYNVGAPKIQEIKEYLESKGFIYYENNPICGTEDSFDADYFFYRQ